MIKIYSSFNSPNVFKVAIAIGEMGLESEAINVDLSKGEQLKPEFLAINPNNRVPAIIDTTPADGGAPLAVFESGAILLYLAEKTGKFLPTDPRGKAEVMKWVFWQAAGQGPMVGQLGHFMHYAPEKIAYPITRYSNEVKRLYRVLDERLKDRDYIAGTYSIADMMCWPWIIFHNVHEINLENYPDLKRWYHAIGERAAVQKAIKDQVYLGPMKMTEEVRKILFNQK